MSRGRRDDAESRASTEQDLQHDLQLGLACALHMTDPSLAFL